MIVRELVNLLGFKLDEASLKKAESGVKSFVDKLESIGTKGMIAITAPITALAGIGIKAYSEYAEALAQIELGLQRTGNAAGRTVAQLAKQASELQDVTIADEGVILREVTNTLIRFGSVAGAQFDRAQKLILDMAAGLDPTMQSMGSVALQVAKALNNPAESLGMLTRSGIKFTDAQEKMIKNMAETNRLAEAQSMILNEIEKQFGGAAAALEKSSTGTIKMKNAFEDILKLFGQTLFPYYRKLNDFLTETFKTLEQFLNPTLRESILIVAGLAAAIPVLTLAFVGVMKAGMLVVETFKMLNAVAAAHKLTMLGMVIRYGLWAAALVAIGATIFLIFNDVYTYIKGGNSLIGKFLEPWAALGPKIEKHIKPVWNAIKVMAREAWAIFSNVAGLIGNIISGNTAGAQKNIDKLAVHIWKMLEYIITVIVPLIPKILEHVFLAIHGLLMRLIQFMADTIKNEISTILELTGIKKLIDPIFNYIEQRINGLKEIFLSMFPFLRLLGGESAGGGRRSGGDRIEQSSAKWNLLETLNNGLNSALFGTQLNDLLMGKGISNAVKTTANVNVNMQASIAMPAGTPQMQTDYIETFAKNLFDKKINDLARNIGYTYAEYR